MTQLSIYSLYGIGICLALRYSMFSHAIPGAIMDIKGITGIAFDIRRLIHHVLDSLLCAFSDHSPSQEATVLPVYNHGDIDSVLLSPIKLNNSSISAVLTWSYMNLSGS